MADLLHQNLASGATARLGLADVEPRARIIAALVFAVAVVSFDQYLSLLMALPAGVGIALASALPLGPTLKRVAAMDLFVVFMLLMLPFTTPGEAMFSLFGYVASWEGLHHAVQIGLKANAILLFLLATVGTLESVRVGHALYRLGCPAALIHILMFTVRYVDVLHLEYSRLTTAMKARGFQPANNWHTYRTYGYLVGMLLVRAMERSERILAAMKCRGFTGAIHLYDTRRFGAADVWFMFAVTIVIAALFGLEWFDVRVD